MKTAAQFRIEIASLRPKRHGSSDYGSRVMPILETYKKLDNYDERRAFQEALELLLRSEDSAERSFAVDICLGFFVFRDAL